MTYDLPERETETLSPASRAMRITVDESPARCACWMASSTSGEIEAIASFPPQCPARTTFGATAVADSEFGVEDDVAGSWAKQGATAKISSDVKITIDFTNIPLF